MKKLLPFLFLFLFVSSGKSASLRDFQTTPVAEEDGDTIATAQVTLTSFTATAIDSGNTTNSVGEVQRVLRRRLVRNMSSSQVYIGTNTVTLNTTGFQIDASTGTINFFSTWNTAPIYGECSAGVSGCTVSIIKETNSIP